MSRSKLSSSLLSRLALQGLDMGDALPVLPGARIQTHISGQPAITLVLDGVVARQGTSGPVSLGLAGPDDLLNFDTLMGGQQIEHGLWLTRGRQLMLSPALLAEKIDQNSLVETAIADLRRRVETAQAEVARQAYGRVTARLAALLSDIHALSGETEIGLRQSDIASLLAVRRAGVSTACGDLQTAGALRVRRSSILLVDIEILGRRSNITPAPSSKVAS